MKYVYLYNEYSEKDICDKFGKNGTFLSESFDLGLNIPNGFVITTDACNEYYENNQKINWETKEQIIKKMTKAGLLETMGIINVNTPERNKNRKTIYKAQVNSDEFKSTNFRK